jgi:hypothetical protein
MSMAFAVFYEESAPIQVVSCMMAADMIYASEESMLTADWHWGRPADAVEADHETSCVVEQVLIVGTSAEANRQQQRSG